MRKHKGTASWLGAFLMQAATSPPGVARGGFVGGHQSGLASCKRRPLVKRRASSCTVPWAMPKGSMGRLSTTECTYLPTLLLNLNTGQHSWNTHGSGFIKPFHHILVHLKNKNMEPSR